MTPEHVAEARRIWLAAEADKARLSPAWRAATAAVERAERLYRDELMRLRLRTIRTAEERRAERLGRR